MKRCPSCEKEVGDDAARVCPSCGRALDEDKPQGSRPAHLAVLDGLTGSAPTPTPTRPASSASAASQPVEREPSKKEPIAAAPTPARNGSSNGSTKPVAPMPPPQAAAPPPEAPEAEDGDDREAKPRLVSRAGPAIPVSRRTDDSVPSGWMARLEAARRGTAVEAAPPAPAAEPEPAPKAAEGPPPLKPPPLKPKVVNAGSFGVKPAHLLVAELEAEEQRKAAARAKAASGGKVGEEAYEESQPSIEQLEIAKPVADLPKRKIPTWIPLLILLVVVAGGTAVGVVLSHKEPPPPVPKVDPELAKKVQRAKDADAAYEQAMLLLSGGKEKAPEVIASYKKAIELEPTMAKAEKGLGTAYASIDDETQAIEHYKKYVALAPTASDAKQVRELIERLEKKARAKEDKKPK